MKRISTSILLLLMLTLSLHLILTLHFCEGDLHSYTMVSKSEPIACCVLSDITENNNLGTQSTNLLESSESCCSFKNVEIITDNFTSEHTTTTIQKPTSFSYFKIAATLNYLINLISTDTIPVTNNYLSPPVLYNTTLKFLAHICVYRL